MGGVRHPHGETVIVHPYLEDAGLDSYNNPIPGWGDDIARHNCAVSPRVEAEDQDRRSRTMIIAGYDVYDTFDCPVTPYDEVTVRGVRHAVDGEVARWDNPFVRGHSGAMYKLKRVDG